MTTLNDFSSCYHHFFIHNFFFPLINAFRGVPLIFVSKHKQQYLRQVTDVLKYCPIRTNSDVITYEGKAYHPLSSIDEQSLTYSLLFTKKDNKNPHYLLHNGTLTEIGTQK